MTNRCSLPCCCGIFFLATVFLTPTAHAQVTTSQYDNARTGANTHETILTPANVNAGQFGKVFALPVDGDVYAQPLYVPKLEIPGKGIHDVLFVATERNSVYAFDAAGQSPQPLWHVNFLDSAKGIESLTAKDVSCPFINPVVGITSTPVIDTATGTIYVLARTKEHDRPVQRVHALDIRTGAEKFGGPIEISASVKHNGADVSFDPLLENPRAALLLANGNVYLSWASSCDVGSYHGWMLAYDARTLRRKAVFNDSPDDEQSGIWAGDTGPAADSSGNIFVATGNGKFDASTGGRDYGDSVLKLAGNDLAVRDYFTPFDQQKLSDSDSDLGSGGPLLLPDQPGAHRHEVLMAGKGSLLYVLDRDNLGQFNPRDDSRAVQTIQAANEAFGAPAYWNGHVYWQVSYDVLRDYALQNGRLALARQGPDKFGDRGATPTISADGTRNGIAWAIETKNWRSVSNNAVLHAYDASNVARPLYNSNQNGSRDRAGTALRFTIPTVADGRVYVGTKNEVDVYGLLPATTKPTPSPKKN